ncbi:MAG: hypothetical protein NZL91_03040 [Thermoflexales bacterium]|nr:hypothetical protein [Thermoflexales bacterium]MCS7325237.1 hypothetical protein [Thermoflexales bacterium]MCX7938651.1 hypothetical protein [Thermoflexales bacterium]MDW8053600.1 hypothetical protein [Anaerolineae bacterium]MDW8292110.1 hypothetical protein [Anaerolineae bacterium]
MTTYPEFPLSLALQNYMPVVLSAIGFALIARMVQREHALAGRFVQLGAGVLIVAGVMKASWKLAMAVARLDVPLFNQAFFPMIAPGFALMAWGLWASRRALSIRALVLPPAAVVVVALGVAAALASFAPGRTWAHWLIAVATIGNVSLAILLTRRALEQRNRLAAALFVLNLIITFALSAIAGMPEKPLHIHWTEQIISTISNAGFAWAAWLITRPHVQVAVRAATA